MVEVIVDSDYEEDLNFIVSKLFFNVSFVDSDDDSMVGFEDDFDYEGGDEEFEFVKGVEKSNGKVFVKKKRK